MNLSLSLKAEQLHKELMPRVEERLAKALSVLEIYLLRTGQEAVRLGRYDVELRNGEMHVALAPPHGWEQREIEWREPTVRRAVSTHDAGKRSKA